RTSKPERKTTRSETITPYKNLKKHQNMRSRQSISRKGKGSSQRSRDVIPSILHHTIKSVE
ncbi:unnamed protein product, partial [Musa acuminata subsp. burmannicoides]